MKGLPFDCFQCFYLYVVVTTDLKSILASFYFIKSPIWKYFDRKEG